MIDFWLEKSQCTGCGACLNVCPRKAIVMKNDNLGFLYPCITDSCIECGLCKRICEERKRIQKNTPRIVYAGWSRNENNRFYSTSGGMFGELADHILNKNGFVVGAAYNNENFVQHIVVSSKNELQRIQQSKYLQSDINTVFTEIKNLLFQGYPVLFCGTPCQVAGLLAFLNKKPDNLFLIDFICRGVNSPKAYKAWLSEIEKDRGKKISKVWFKYKNDGWKSSPRCTKLIFCDNSEYILSGKENLFMQGYLGPNLYIRPSCADCDFKGQDRLSDITLADFWGIEKELDDDQGTSMVLVNSDKGRALLEEITDKIQLFEKDLSDVIKGNPSFHESVVINKNSKQFLVSLDKKPFSKAIKPYFSKQSLLKRLVKKLLRCFKIHLKSRKRKANVDLG